MKNMHLKRWLTSLVALPFLIVFLYRGGPFLFLILISLVSLIALWEYFHVVYKNALPPVPLIIPLTGYITGAAIIFTVFYELFNVVLCLIAFNLIIVGLISVFLYKKDTAVLELTAKQIQGIVYIPLFLSCLVLIRNGENGTEWIFLILILIMMGDTGAFYTGTYLGRHKLSPFVSPGKTMEGAAGGLVANLLGGILFKYYFMPHLHWGLCLIFFICIGLAGQVGDLFESLFKRVSGVKDSGNILPGHGGMLDRIDALLFASPVAYLFIKYIF